MGLINYLGNSKVIKRICQLLKVTDVQDGEGHSLVDENGIAIVSGGGGGSSTLADLTDVDVTGASDGDVLAYNGTSQKWEDKGLANVATSGSYNDLSNKPTIPAAQVNSDWSASSGVAQILNKPTALSSFTNDQGFITSSVNNLTNYYLKSETYTKTEVNTLIGQISTISILVVQSLPTQDIQTNIIYLVPKQTAGTQDVYDEYIYVNNAWELIGDTEVDLSNYYTKSETDTLLNAKTNETSSFTEAQTRTNITSGDTITTILGKIKKYFTDLASVAFSGSYNDLSNQPTIPSVSANPSTTTATLSGIEIDGTAYAIQGGGHTIKNDSGTALAQKDNLKFAGVYSANSGDDTVVNIVRQMTKAQIEAATGEAAKGFMEATDEDSDLPFTSDIVECAGNQSLTQKLSAMDSSIASASTATGTEYSSGVSVKDKIDGKVNKSGDTISGIFAPSSDRGCSIGQDNQRINYAWIYRVVGVTSIEKSANSGAYRQALQDKAGTLALMENLDIASLYANGYFPNGGTWSNRITLSDDIDNYKYLGFSWVGADQAGYGGLIEKIIDVGNFKRMTQQQPFPLYHDIVTPSDTRAILLAYYDDTHIDVYRGTEIYQYNRLWITGIIKK